jgi:C-terminal processing protease CtpA/Prc
MSYALVARPCRAPAQRYVLRSGYRSQRGGSPSYSAGFYTLAADSYDPGLLPPERRPAAKRIVFLVDRAAHLPAVALALQSAGDARIVATAPLGDDAVAATERIDLGEGVAAQVRVSEVVPDADFPGVHADVELPAGITPEQALQAAAAELHKDGWGTPRHGVPAPLPGPVFRLDPTYPGMTEPDLPHRQLAVIRAWNVIHYFYPYLPLIGDWDAVLPELLAKMETAATGRDYALTIAEMMTHVPDGHTTLYGHPELAKYFGPAGLPFAVRWIEGMAVVVNAGSDEAKQAGIAPGDAIVAVDGEAVPDRLKRLSRYVSASSPEILNAKLCSQYLLRGPAGPAVLGIQGADGKTREVHLTRDPKFRYFEAEETGETVRVLPGNWGYADLRRLTVQEVDGLFEKVKDTRGLILDMRGYPQGTAWSIAPRINTRGAKIGAQFRRAQVMAFSAEEGESGFYFNQSLPPLPAGKPLYTRPVVMLIDDRAISQSEHSGLFYEAANGIKFIGAPTAGANGDVTQLSLPGGLYVVFTGHDVRHADGRQLQRIGLQPDIPAAPTRAGLRAGKDEVLERAVRYLEERSPEELTAH